MTDDERAAAKDVFLAAFARSANVSQSAKRAHVSRETVYQWLANDAAFKARYEHADADAQDVLRAETFRRAVRGVSEPLTNAHGLVYEYEPVIGPDGQPELDDRGRTKMKRGKLVTVKKYSDALLAKMLSARVPEYREKRQLELTGRDGGPIQYGISDDPESAALARALVARITSGGAADPGGSGLSGE